MKSHRIKSLLRDKDFLDVVADTRAMLTKKVMHKSTSDDDRLMYLAEYHALDKLLAHMGSEAQNAETKDNV